MNVHPNLRFSLIQVRWCRTKLLGEVGKPFLYKAWIYLVKRNGLHSDNVSKGICMDECKSTADKVFWDIYAFMNWQQPGLSSAIVATWPGKTPICPVVAEIMTISTWKVYVGIRITNHMANVLRSSWHENKQQIHYKSQSNHLYTLTWTQEFLCLDS